MMTYQDYLNSAHWRGLRRDALKRDGYCCRRCGSRKNLQVHHLFYRAGWLLTILADLITYCRSCHERAHGIEKPCKPLRPLKQLQKERLWRENRRRKPQDQVAWSKRKKKKHRQKKKWRAPKWAGASAFSQTAAMRAVTGRY